ncbi:MAG TPA: serine/threonine-protein kinase [Kofleriaceae bacterium]
MTEPLDNSDIRHGAKIGRFVVEGQLGAGAMGVVYAAHDRELDRRVALKVLKGTGDQEALLRLQREGQAMARVTHPNVITVHEAGIQGRLVFLAQELLDGGSLRQWLEGKHSQREILDKFVAAGRGLAAAHAAGLVHRDFKPDNVLLGKDGRVRVSDFGLARSLAGLQTVPHEPRLDPSRATTHDIVNSPMATMTQTGAVMGTPLYMSPEQHRGEPADERSDQFSFSVALYQSLYGDAPFPGKTVVALADAVIAGRMQPPPRSAKVPAHLRRVLLRGLSTDPRKRYPSMDALLADLTHDPSRKLRRIGIVAGLAVLIAGASIGGYVISSRTKTGAEVPAERTIAVIGFKNLSGDKQAEWVSSAMSGLLANELAKGDDVSVTPAEDAHRARIELKLPNQETFGKDTLGRIRERLGSDAIVLGSFLQTGDQLTLIVVVEDLPRGKSSRFELKGGVNELPTLAMQAGTRVREALRISSVALAKQELLGLPKNADAARAYVEGRDALRRNDFGVAKERLIAATQKDPDFAPAYIELADAYQGSFEGDAAKLAAQKALDTAKKLDNIDQQQLVTGQAYERLGQPAKAREQYRKLFDTSPRREYGLALLRVETLEDLPARLASVRKLGADPRIDLIEAQAELYKANSPRALELAQAAGKAAQASGAWIVAAEARRVEGEAQLALGQLGAAAEALEASRKQFDAARDVVARLAVMELIAAVSLERGELDDASAKFDTVAGLRLQAGQADLAARAWATAAYATALRGRIADAEKQMKKAEDNKAQDPYAIAQVDLAAAWIAWAKGDSDSALRRSEQCAARANSDGLRVLCFELNGQIRADRADPVARKTFEDALALAEQAQNPQRVGALQLALAMLDLDDGQEASAIGRAETVQIDAAKRGATSLEAYAWTVLARAHLGQAETQKALADLEHVKTEPQALRLRVHYKIADGLAHHFLGDSDYAKDKIEAVRAETQKQACVGLLLETRLARAQILPEAEGKAELDAVMRDAKAGNFNRIVKLAEALTQQQ